MHSAAENREYAEMVSAAATSEPQLTNANPTPEQFGPDEKGLSEEDLKKQNDARSILSLSGMSVSENGDSGKVVIDLAATPRRDRGAANPIFHLANTVDDAFGVVGHWFLCEKKPTQYSIIHDWKDKKDMKKPKNKVEEVVWVEPKEFYKTDVHEQLIRLLPQIAEDDKNFHLKKLTLQGCRRFELSPLDYDRYMDLGKCVDKIAFEKCYLVRNFGPDYFGDEYDKNIFGPCVYVELAELVLPTNPKPHRGFKPDTEGAGFMANLPGGLSRQFKNQMRIAKPDESIYHVWEDLADLMDAQCEKVPDNVESVLLEEPYLSWCVAKNSTPGRLWQLIKAELKLYGKGVKNIRPYYFYALKEAIRLAEARKEQKFEGGKKIGLVRKVMPMSGTMLMF